MSKSKAEDVFLVYVGPSDAVEIPSAGIVAERDVPVSVPAELASLLLEQAIWVRPPVNPVSKENL